MRRHRWYVSARSAVEAVDAELAPVGSILLHKSCKRCGALLILPPPSGMSYREYARRLGVSLDCDVEQCRQVLET